MGEPETVFIVDDDASVRRSLSLFLTANNFRVESFGSSEEFLDRESFTGTGCLVLDVNLEGKNGFDLQHELSLVESHLPIIFITGRGNIPMSVQALKKGAVNFLEKPFSDKELLHSIHEALVISRKLKTDKEVNLKAKNLVKLLTPRELEILRLVMTGLLNKQIAYELSIAVQTVKLHRQSISKKLGVKSVPEMIRIVEKAGLSLL